MIRALLAPRNPTSGQIVAMIMWPLAIVAGADMVIQKAIPGHHTNDFKPVYTAIAAFWRHGPVYTANLNSVGPHYLYPPGGTLLLAPIGLLDEHTGRLVFLFLNLAAAILAIHLLLRMFGHSWRSPLAPVAYFALFLSEALVNTLTFGNVNGLFFLAEVVFLTLLLGRRDTAAGIVLGVTIAIKPILAPLLLLPAVRRQWSTVALAVAVPMLATAVAWPLAADPGHYFVHNLPYSLRIRDYYNSSISGFGVYYDVPGPAILLVRGLLALAVMVSLWLLYRYYREQELFFVTTTAGVLLTAEFALSSLGQQYYSMFLFPFLFTIVIRNSLLRNWPAWLAIFAFYSYETWHLFRWPSFGRNVEYSRTTFGWALLLIVVCCVLVDRYLAARREGRLANGIDPVHLASVPVPGRTAMPDGSHRLASIPSTLWRFCEHSDQPSSRRPIRHRRTAGKVIYPLVRELGRGRDSRRRGDVPGPGNHGPADGVADRVADPSTNNWWSVFGGPKGISRTVASSAEHRRRWSGAVVDGVRP